MVSAATETTLRIFSERISYRLPHPLRAGKALGGPTVRASAHGITPNWSQHPDYLLLDGQQRCTAIAVGFLNPWGISGHADAEFALWVDLEAPESADVRDHAFRLLTRSHPWGYQRQNPGDRLSASGRRQAMAEFEASARSLGQDKLEFGQGGCP